ADQNIQLVVGLGDIVDGGGITSQWQTADAAYRLLDGKVPYAAAQGNHDYDANNPSGRTASSNNFNRYFGPAPYLNRPEYAGSFPSGSNENFYELLQLGGRSYLVLVLEFDARDIALDWASQVVAAHPNSDVIVVTHSFTYYDNMRLSRCDVNSAATFGVAQDNDGEDMWRK